MERDIFFISLINFFTILSWSTVSLILVLYAGSFGAPSTMLGVIWSVIGIARFLTENPGGMFIDRFGRRPIILSGLMIIISSYITYSLAQSITDIFISSGIAGVGFVLAQLGLSAYAADIAPSDKVAGHMGIFQSSGILAGVVGPVFGGFIAETYGLQKPFIASALFVTIALILALFKSKETKSRESTVRIKGKLMKDYRQFLTNRLYFTLFFITFLQCLAGWSFGSIMLPIYGVEVLSLTISQLGLLSTITSIVLFPVQLFLAGFLEGRISRSVLIISGSLVSGAATFAFIFHLDFYSLVALSVVSGIGGGIVGPSLAAVWADSTTVENRGRVYGIRATFFDVGRIIWPTFVTFLMDRESYLPFYAFALATLIIVSLYSIILRKK